MATQAKTTLALGSKIRMRPLKPSELPAHPSLAALQSPGSAPPLTPFLSAILDEGHDFITEYLPATFTVKSKNKPSPPSTGTVQLLAHDISAHELPGDGRTTDAPGEAWFARTSVHQNAAKGGTASWEEFDGGIRAEHSKHEGEYTPGILDSHQILSWSEELAATGKDAGQWKEVDAYLMEMLHKIPAPFNKRVFQVLVISAKKDNELMDVQIPVDMSSIKDAKYNEDPRITVGVYCSAERCELIEDGAKIHWQMATASDAKGILPMWIQKLGVPSAVIKDVGLFIGWVGKNRTG